MRPRVVAVVAAITVTAALVGGPATAQVKKADVPGILNLSRLDSNAGVAGPTVGFGGATQPSAMAWLKDEGFVAVINLRLATEEDVDIDASRTAAEAAGLKFVHLPFDPEDPDLHPVDPFRAAVGEAANQPVYINCHSGTRVAALWMITRVLTDGWEVDAAREEAEAIAAKPDEAVAFAVKYLESLQNPDR
jgi:uncharacterized protein (TIGR01244 family)